MGLDYRALQRVPLFAAFSEEALNGLMAASTQKSITKGTMLFVTGDEAEHLYIMLSGWVKLFRETRDGHEYVHTVMRSDDVFGHNAVLKESTLPYSAEVMEDGHVLSVPTEALQKLANEAEAYQTFLTELLKESLEEQKQQHLEAEHLAIMTSAERVGCFLLKLCGEKREGSISLTLPHEKALVAGQLGMAPETFSRSLQKLKDFGIYNKQSDIYIEDIDAMQQHVCKNCSALLKDCGLSEETC